MIERVRRLGWPLLLAVLGPLPFGRAQDSGEVPGPDSPPAPSEVEVLLVEGQVTDSIGAGQSSVTVTAYRQAQDGSRGERIAEASTDQLGDFKIHGPNPITGTIVVVFSKDSFAELAHEVELVPGEIAPYLAETLLSKLALTGKVESAADHQPIGGAAIELQAAYQRWQATSEPDGTFRIQGVPAGRGEVAVTAEGFGREQLRIKDTAQAGELTIALKPERVVHVSIVDDQEKPIFGAVVEVLDEDRGDFRSMIADEQGAMVLRGIHFDVRKLICRLTHKAHVSSIGFDRTIELPADEPESTHQLVLQRAATVSGTVRDESGQPLYGARVVTGSQPSDDSPRDWTDVQGHYEIVGVPPGECVVTVHMTGYAPDLKTVAARIAETATVDFRLALPAIVKGRVVDENRQPVAQAEVWATRWRGHRSLGLRAMTDAEGGFVIENAPHDEFEAVVAGSRVKSKTVTLSAANPEPVEITLEIGDEDGDVATLARGQDAPALSLTALDGQPIDLSALKGKVVVVDFWATWCAPCVAELPRVIDVYEKYKGRKDFTLIGISRDFVESDLRAFLKDRPKVAWPQIMSTGGGDEAVAKFGVSGIPALFVIDPGGKVFASQIGADELIEHIEKVFALAASGSN